MSLKGTLTNEKLTTRYDNLFTLVNYAIGLTKKRIARGEGLESNVPAAVLEDIAEEDPSEEEVEEGAEEATAP